MPADAGDGFIYRVRGRAARGDWRHHAEAPLWRAGLYADDVFFALLSNDTLYLKVGDSNRADFIAAGMGPFKPPGHPGLVMRYYEVPVEVLEDAEELGRWAVKAIAAAIAKKTKKITKQSKPKKRKKPKLGVRRAKPRREG